MASLSGIYARFGPPNILLFSYINKNSKISQETYNKTLNWCGMPISISQFHSDNIDTLTKQQIGSFFAIDVIENNDTKTNLSEITEPGIAKYTNLDGQRIEIAMIDNKYYFAGIKLDEQSDPKQKIIFNDMPYGMPQCKGFYDELILNKSTYTMDDIDTDPNTGELDFKYLNLGGVPLTIGRVNSRYYLIVKPISRP